MGKRPLSKREIEEQRKKEEEEAAAHVSQHTACTCNIFTNLRFLTYLRSNVRYNELQAFQEFVETFTDVPGNKAGKVWVKAGTYDAGKRRK